MRNENAPEKVGEVWFQNKYRNSPKLKVRYKYYNRGERPTVDPPPS